jgi:hypothetical protein
MGCSQFKLTGYQGSRAFWRIGLFDNFKLLLGASALGVEDW